MSLKKFLTGAGLILVLVSIAAFLKFIPFMAGNNLRNWTLFSFGLFSIFCSAIVPSYTQKYVVIFQSIIAMVIAVVSIFSLKIFSYSLYFPFDTIMFGVFGIWGLFAVSKAHPAINKYVDSLN